MRPDVLLHDPWETTTGLVFVLALKTVAAAVALRLVGLKWKAALGMGLGLAQLGELSFVVLSAGTESKLIPRDVYDQVLFIALGTLVLTPQLLKTGLRFFGEDSGSEKRSEQSDQISTGPVERAVVVGLGPIGSRVATQLETGGIDVCLIDLSPVNLHAFAQQGFRTIAGDASDPATLHHAQIHKCRLAAVTVPDDLVARNIVAAIRAANADCTIVVRCRYQASAAAVRRAGANAVVSEETEAAGAILRLLAKVRPPDRRNT
jgi:CPA2 family monovalent cation:H+ antiporter-2